MLIIDKFQTAYLFSPETHTPPDNFAVKTQHGNTQRKKPRRLGIPRRGGTRMAAHGTAKGETRAQQELYLRQPMVRHRDRKFRQSLIRIQRAEEQGKGAAHQQPDTPVGEKRDRTFPREHRRRRRRLCAQRARLPGFGGIPHLRLLLPKDRQRRKPEQCQSGEDVLQRNVGPARPRLPYDRPAPRHDTGRINRPARPQRQAEGRRDMPGIRHGGKFRAFGVLWLRRHREIADSGNLVARKPGILRMPRPHGRTLVHGAPRPGERYRRRCGETLDTATDMAMPLDLATGQHSQPVRLAVSRRHTSVRLQALPSHRRRGSLSRGGRD